MLVRHNSFRQNSSFGLILIENEGFTSHFCAIGNVLIENEGFTGHFCAIGNVMQISIGISYTFGGVFLDLQHFLRLVRFRARTSQFFVSKLIILARPNSK